MHEVKIVLDRRSRFVRRCLDQPHVFHKVLAGMNPEKTRILWRLAKGNLIVRSVRPLDWKDLDARDPSFGQRNHVAFDPNKPEGTAYFCNVFAYARKRPVVGPWQPKSPDEYLEWFELQGNRYGFDVLESAIIRQEPYHVETSSMPLTVLPVELMGAIRITDSEKFRAALEEGIGRLRAFGCGLMLLRPIQGLPS